MSVKWVYFFYLSTCLTLAISKKAKHKDPFAGYDFNLPSFNSAFNRIDKKSPAPIGYGNLYNNGKTGQNNANNVHYPSPYQNNEPSSVNDKYLPKQSYLPIDGGFQAFPDPKFNQPAHADKGGASSQHQPVLHNSGYIPPTRQYQPVKTKNGYQFPSGGNNLPINSGNVFQAFQHLTNRVNNPNARPAYRPGNTHSGYKPTQNYAPSSNNRYQPASHYPTGSSNAGSNPHNNYVPVHVNGYNPPGSSHSGSNSHHNVAPFSSYNPPQPGFLSSILPGFGHISDKLNHPHQAGSHHGPSNPHRSQPYPQAHSNTDYSPQNHVAAHPPHQSHDNPHNKGHKVFDLDTGSTSPFGKDNYLSDLNPSHAGGLNLPSLGNLAVKPVTGPASHNQYHPHVGLGKHGGHKPLVVQHTYDLYPKPSPVASHHAAPHPVGNHQENYQAGGPNNYHNSPPQKHQPSYPQHNNQPQQYQPSYSQNNNQPQQYQPSYSQHNNQPQQHQPSYSHHNNQPQPHQPVYSQGPLPTGPQPAHNGYHNSNPAHGGYTGPNTEHSGYPAPQAYPGHDSHPTKDAYPTHDVEPTYSAHGGQGHGKSNSGVPHFPVLRQLLPTSGQYPFSNPYHGKPAGPKTHPYYNLKPYTAPVQHNNHQTHPQPARNSIPGSNLAYYPVQQGPAHVNSGYPQGPNQHAG